MAVKKYLDETGLTEVAAHVNTRLKTVTTMPVTADEGAIRMYCGETTSNFIKGHTYQMRATLEQRLQFSADTTTYFMTQDGTITDVAPTSYSPQIEGIPVTDPETGAELVYMAGNNALVQRLGSDVNTITVDFNKIKSSVMPWWTAGAATGSYNPYTIRNVKLVSITEWVDITPSGSILSVGSVNDLLTAWTQMNNDSTAVVNVTTTFALNADYNIPTGRHFLLKGSDADKTTLWTNDGRIFSATLEASALVWTELHDDSKLSKVDELPSNPSVGDTVLYNGTTGTETEGHIYRYKDLTEHFTGAEVDGTYYDMNGNEIATPTDPEYSTSITVSEGGYVLCVDSAAGKLFAKKTEDDTTYSVTMNNDGTFTVGDAYTPESSVAAVGGNIATWSVEEFGWVDLTPNTEFNPDDFDVSDSNEVSLVESVKKIFEGTEEEFLDLPLAERKKYDEIHSPDGLDESQITDSITDGDMRAVTSNAVAQVVPSNASAINKLISKTDADALFNAKYYSASQAPDCDNITENYVLVNAGNSYVEDHYPVQDLFFVKTIYSSADDAFQTAIAYGTIDPTQKGVMYSRVKTSGTWSSWKKLATSDDMTSLLKNKMSCYTWGTDKTLKAVFYEITDRGILPDVTDAVGKRIIARYGNVLINRITQVNGVKNLYWDDTLVLSCPWSDDTTKLTDVLEIFVGTTSWQQFATISTPQNGLITITSVLGANADATTTYTKLGVGDLVNVVIDSGVLFTTEWWGTVNGLSSLGITHIQNVQGISGECRILARVCKTNGSIYLDLLRDSGVATKNDISYKYATSVTSKQYTFNFNTPGISVLEIIATGYSDVRVAGHWIVNCVGTFGPSCQVISDNGSSSIQSCTFSVSDTVLTMSFTEEPYSVLVKELARA